MSEQTTESKPGQLLANVVARHFAEAGGDHVGALQLRLRGFNAIATSHAVDLIAHLTHADDCRREIDKLICEALDAKRELEALGLDVPPFEVADARAALVDAGKIARRLIA